MRVAEVDGDGLVCRYDVGFSGFPGIGDFGEDCGGETLQRFLAGEEADDAGSTFDLAVEGFAGVGCPELSAMMFRQCKESEAFREVFLGPGNKLWLFVAPNDQRTVP